MASVRVEIEEQQTLDRKWRTYQAMLDARIRAVIDARRAFARRELGAGWAFRQSLVDLAAVCELLAAELPRAAHPDPATTGAERARGAV